MRRHRPHSPSTAPVTVPETRTPSDTDSNRRSSRRSAPVGTPISSRPRPSGAGTVRSTTRIAPGRRGRSLVSRTNGDRGSSWWLGVWCGIVRLRPWLRPSGKPTSYSRSARRGRLAALSVGLEGEGAFVFFGLEGAHFAEGVHLVAAAFDRREGTGEELLEVGQRGVDVVVDLLAQPLGLRPRLARDPPRLVLGRHDDLVDRDQAGVFGLALRDDPFGFAAPGVDDLVALVQ